MERVSMGFNQASGVPEGQTMVSEVVVAFAQAVGELPIATLGSTGKDTIAEAGRVSHLPILGEDPAAKARQQHSIGAAYQALCSAAEYVYESSTQIKQGGVHVGFYTTSIANQGVNPGERAPAQGGQDNIDGLTERLKNLAANVGQCMNKVMATADGAHDPSRHLAEALRLMNSGVGSISDAISALTLAKQHLEAYIAAGGSSSARGQRSKGAQDLGSNNPSVQSKGGSTQSDRPGIGPSEGTGPVQRLSSNGTVGDGFIDWGWGGGWPKPQ